MFVIALWCIIHTLSCAICTSAEIEFDLSETDERQWMSGIA